MFVQYNNGNNVSGNWKLCVRAGSEHSMMRGRKEERGALCEQVLASVI